MKLLELRMQGFLSHEDTHIDFRDLNYLAISGKNGAGKSSIRQAISWAKFGTTRVASRSESIINDNCDRATVELIGQLEDGQTIKIERTKGWTGSAKVRVYELLDEEWISTGDHLNATHQQKIVDSLGIDEDAYYSLSVIESSAGSRFVLADSTKRRDILLSLIPELSEWPNMLARAKYAVDQLDKLMESSVAKLERTREMSEQAEEGIKSQEARLDTHRESAPEKEDFDELLEEISQKLGSASAAKKLVLSKLKEAKTQLDFDLNQFDSQIDKIESAINKDNEAHKRLDRISSTVSRTKKSVKRAQAVVDDLPEAEDFESRIEELTENETRLTEKLSDIQSDSSLYSSKLKDAEEHKDSLQEIDEETGVCFVCKSELSEEQHKSLIDSTRNSVSEFKNNLEDARESKKKVQRNLDEVKSEIRSVRLEERRFNDTAKEAKEELKSLKATLKRERGDLADLEDDVLDESERSALQAKIVELDEEANDREALYNTKTLPKLQRELEKLDGNQDVNDMIAERKDIQSRKDIYFTHAQREDSIKVRIDEGKQNLKKLNADIAQYEADAEPLRKKMEDLVYVQKAVSPKGIPSMLLDSVLASIEDRQNEILAGIPGAEWMKVEFSQARDLKNGNKKDVLDIMVHAANGKVRPIESFSSGERVKLTISNIFAMAQVFNERCPGTVDYLFLDEPLGVLDEESVPAFIDVLRSVMNRKIVSSIYIVAHDQRVIDALPQTMIVEKLDSGSKITIS